MTLNVGVNLVEGPSASPVAGVSTAVSAIIGNFVKGDLNKAVLVTSFADFTSKYGNAPASGSTAWYSVKAFFRQIGSASLYIVRVASSAANKATVTLGDKGSDADTLTVDAKTEGTHGNALSVDIDDHNILTTTLLADLSAGATEATVTSIGGLEVGSDLHFDDATNDEYVRIIQIDAANNKVTWSGGLSNPYAAADTTVTSVEFTLKVYLSGLLVETHSGLSMNNAVSFFCEKAVVSDYITVTDVKAADTSYADLPAATSSPEALTTGADGLADVTASDYQGVQASKTGVYALDAVTDLFRFCCPDPTLTDASAETALASVIQSLLDYANSRVTVQYYADLPKDKSVTAAVTFTGQFEGRRLCFFFPWLKAIESSLEVIIPPSALVMGRAVAKDYSRGVHKSIGNERLAYALDLNYHVSTAEGETLNNAGINAIKVPWPGAGIRTFGARTRSAVTAWRFIHVSEYWNYLGRTLDIASQSIIGEPNDSRLWKRTKGRFEALLAQEQRSGALFDASRPGEQAYVVVMDETNNPAAQVALGLATIHVEYVVVGTVEKFKILLTSSTSGITVSEA